MYIGLLTIFIFKIFTRTQEPTNGENKPPKKTPREAKWCLNNTEILTVEIFFNQFQLKADVSQASDNLNDEIEKRSFTVDRSFMRDLYFSEDKDQWMVNNKM